RDPLVPHSRFTSNDAPFMLVPSITPALLAYLPGPPRRLQIQGSRLILGAGGGETIIGRAAIDRAQYVTAAPNQIVVPIPDTLPTRGVNVLVGAALPDPIPLGAGAQTLDITIGGVTRTITANLPATIPRAAAANILASLIHDAAQPLDAAFTGARVDLWHDRL